MEHTGKTNACLAWLNANYNLTSLSVADIIDLTIEWNNKDAMENAAQYYQLLQEQKKKEEERKKKEEEYEKPLIDIDFNEETDENGCIWYRQTHWRQQREESRKLKPGDIIKYETTFDDVHEEGIMIVDSFDYESDFAARSYVQLTTWTKEKDPNYKHKFVAFGLAPGIKKFSFATEDEIKKFFTYIKEEEYEKYLFYFVRDGKYVPNFIKKEKRYAKYLT